jgi:DNA-binding transcriptional ArsR family regulator
MAEQDASGVFKALADPTRRDILEMLRDGECSAGEIAGQFDMAAPSVSRHLALLKAAQLVEDRREGNRIFYSLSEERLAHVLGQFMSAVCPTQLARKVRRKKGKR